MEKKMYSSLARLVFVILCLSLPRRTLSQNQNATIPLGASTLAFVFDVTGSMHDDLVQVIAGAAEIMATTQARRQNPLYNYVLVPFHDPEIGPVLVTTDPEEFQRELRDLFVQGGGDCPEMSIGAIKEAIVVSLPNSYIYVFTDARSKDFYLTEDVLILIQQKQSQVVFVLTGDCGNQTHQGYTAYEKIASTSSGQVFLLKKDQVNQVLNFVRQTVQARKVNLMSIDRGLAMSKILEIPIDSKMQEFTISLSGSSPEISLWNPSGQKVRVKELLNLKKVKVVNIANPSNGIWKINVTSNSSHTIRVTGLSIVDFAVGFSRKFPKEMLDTEQRPLANVSTYAMVNMSGLDYPGSLNKLQLVDLSGKTITELPLTQDDRRRNIYTVDAFVPPKDFFFVKVIGSDSKAYTLWRTTPTAISPRKPSLPMVLMPEITRGYYDLTATIICSVKSDIPYFVQWYKDGVKVGPELFYSEDENVPHSIPFATTAQEGIYTCNATNVAGSTSSTTFLDISEPPPDILPPVDVSVRPNSDALLNCVIYSTVPYNVTWYGPSGIIHNSRKFDVYQNGSLLIRNVILENEGQYVCRVGNEGGYSQEKMFLRVHVPPRAYIKPQDEMFQIGGSVALTCFAEGFPKPSFYWTRDGKVMIENERININDNQISISKMVRGDEGDYKCIAKNVAGENAAVALLLYIEKPRIVLYDKKVLVASASTATLKCVAEGIPKPRIHWYKGDLELKQLDYVKISAKGDLSIIGIGEDDEGEYRCVAENDAGDDFIDTFIKVGSPPRIIKPPYSTAADLSTNASFPCEAMGDPEPKGYWLKNGNRIVSGGRISHDKLGTGRLTIANVTPTDGANYTCVYQNQFGVTQVSAFLTVTGIVKPVIAFTNPFVNVIEGNEVDLSCVVLEGNPPPRVQWFKNGKNLQTNSHFRRRSPGEMVINNIKEVHEGDYTCVATNWAGNATFVVSINVQVPPKHSYNSDLDRQTNFTVTQGGGVTLPCDVTGDPKPTISWYKDGSPISLTSYHYFIKEDGSLEIFSANAEDTGQYRCTATNIAGEIDKDIDLFVDVPPTIKGEDFESYTVKVDETIVLPCIASGRPPPTVSWRKLFVAFKPKSDRFLFSPLGLTISKAQISDKAIYECIAENVAGVTQKVITLIVQKPPIIKPDGESQLTIVEGDSATLNCETTGDPPPTVEWKRNGVILDTSIENGFEVIGTGSLKINSATLSDDGNYLCTSSNPAGDAVRLFSLTVQAPPALPINLANATEIIENNPIVLPCPAIGTPPPLIRWYKDGVELTYQTIGVDFLPDGSLEIKNTQGSDTAEYKCVATNVAGEVEHTVDLFVLIPPKIIGEDIGRDGQMEIDKVVLNNSITLNCTIEGTPKPNITWLRNGDVIQPNGERVHISADGKSLTIHQAKLADKARYKCVATNVAGQTEMKFELDIYVPPSIDDQSASLSNLSVILGSSLFIDCPVSGTPTPKIIWFKDGEVISPEIDPTLQTFADGRRLEIINARVTDTGLYKCEGVNVAGSVEKEFEVDVHVPPTVENPGEIARPEVIKNNPLRLTCPASGIPIPKIIWFKGNKAIKSNTTRYTLLHDGWTLEIRDTQEEDSTRFTCRAQNDAGTNEKAFDVNVLVPPDISEESINVNPKVTVNRSIVINCPVDGIPPPTITWYKNDMIIDTTVNRQYEIISKGRQLRISNAQLFDTGLFVCEARNKAGTDKLNYSLEVQVPSKIDQFNTNTNPKVTVNGTVSVFCPAYGVPVPTITWFKGASRITLDDNPNIQILDEGRILEISNAQVNDTSIYTCQATNEAGSSELNFDVFVEVPPSISNIAEIAPKVKEGQTRTIECPAFGTPEPEITWLKNGQPINYEVETSLIEQNGGKSLLIYNAQIEDGGIYTCVATNPAGVAQMEFVLDVWVPPTIDQTAFDKQNAVLKGGVTVLNCPATGLPPPEIMWFKDGEPLKLTSRMQIITGGIQLKITDATLTDTARYTCTASNPAGSASADMDLSVLVPPSIDESNLVYRPEIEQNRTVILECPVSGVPEPKVRWLFNDVTVRETRRMFLKSNNRQLQIHYAEVEDSGEYTCIAFNDAGDLRKVFRLQVLVPPSILSDLVSPDKLAVKQYQNVSIYCPVDGIPIPSIFWLKDKVPLLNLPYKNMRLSEAGQRLVIKDVQVEDAAQYTCTVTNKAGQIKKSFDLSVWVPPIIDRAGTTDIFTHLEGETVTFDCATVGIPEPTVEWIKDNQPINVSSLPNVRLLSGGQQLEIVSTEVTDTAVYTCIAKNLAGTAKKLYDLEIQVPPRVDDLQVRNMSVIINQHLTLKCPVNGIPPPEIKWMRQNDVIPSYGNPSIFDGDSKLSLSNVQLLDSGEYSCVITNPAGSVKVDFDVQVLLPPTIEADGPNKVIKVKNRRAILSCNSVGIPPPEVKWTKNGVHFPSFGLRHRMLPGGSLEFFAVRLADKGKYVCTVTNSAGEDSREVQLVVQVPPKILGSQQLIVSAKGGQDVRLPCQVKGTPTPKVAWQRGASIIKSSPDREILQNNTLILRRINPRQRGVYICIARNNAGLRTKHIKLEIYQKPKIETQKTNFVVQQPNYILLPCEVRSRRRPKISWKKDGELITNSDTRFRLLGSGSLFIPFSMLNLTGTYTCIAENQGGIDSKDFTLDVNASPEIKKGRRLVTANVGETVQMNCTATGQPRPTVTWRKDGAEVHSVVAKYAVTRFGILTISNLEVEDTGSYTCTASNTVGRDYHEQTLKVQVPPKITEAPKNQEVVINGNIYLTCSAFGIPTPTITWTRNGKYIKTNPGANGKSFVTINDVEGSNAGIYKCTAENVAGRASASATVLIKSPPRVTVPDGDAFVTVAEKVILTCSVGGDPTADIRWLKNGRPVRFSNRIKLLTNGSLLILDSTSSDAGLYKCVASNDAGISEGIAMLTVNEPPVFKIEPINMRINEGDTTIMNCVAEGEPTPTISWLRGWDDLVPDGHISILPNNSLRIIGTQLSDSGIYRCKASNNLGITIVEASITVVVHGRFSPWTTWGICSSTCGVGVQFRTRSCDNPPPQNGGRSCTGSVLDSKTCVSGHCPVDGQWGNWLLWEECSTTCGNGERRRTRVCDNPQHQHGGKPCNGNSSEVETCSVRMCSVNGNWGSWSNWSLCSVSCGDGIQERTRECDNPAPQYGGQACQGDRKDKKSCSTQDCAVDGTWGQWSVWSSCSQSCGGGSKNRSRLCDSPRPMYGGSPCVGRNVQVDYCNPEPCPVNGNWSPWGSWGDCSASCDRAHRKRFRSCSNPSPSINGRMCVGASEDSQTCNTSPCPVNGVWEQWGPWLPCSQTCDKGYRERKRTCRVPQHGGQNCVGNNIQRDECLLQACSRNPLQANGNILGVIGGVEINEGKLSAVISPSVNGTGVNVNATISNVPQTVAKHLRYLVSVINPVYWTVAQEIDGAYNGFSLTDGKFSRQVQVEFVTGEVLQMTQYVSGVDKNGVLQVDVIVRGNVPNLPPNSEIQLLPYRESYVQTGKGNVYAYSSRAFRVNGHILPYAWNHTITYETDRLMPVLVETLYARDMDVILDTTGRKVHFTLHSSIGPGIPSNQCPQGFSLNSEGQFCTDIDECQKSESCSHYCHNSPGKYSCSCPLGFLLDMLGRNCIDVDECKTNNGGCSDGYDCVNTEGSSHCVIVCATGYMRHPNNRSCIDIDECKDNPGVCGQHCVNVPGSYKCSCSDGFRLTENGRCTDLNECRTRSSSCSHICRNSIGSYWCTCPAGYRLIDKYNCIDIDECGEGTHRCSDSQDCVNVKGSYRCVQRCPLGFKKINGACTDVDECLERIDRCYSNQQCINSEGSYYCQCEKGYRSRGPGTPCLDINECVENPRVCSYRCVNTYGDFQCICPPGQKRLADKKSCAGLEYLEPSRVSYPYQYRQSLPSSSGCRPPNRCYSSYSRRYRREACPTGFRFSPVKNECLDIDECQEDKEICQHNCTNKVGSYACTCPPGYKVARNGRNCIDINECLDPSIDCGTGKMCFNKRGDFSCIDTPCPLTYKRDPQTNYCVLECVDAEQPCPPGARYADVIEFRTLALPSGIVAHQDLIRLTAYNQDDIKLPKTDFYILENDPKISFQLRLVDGTGILYTLRPLVETETYQIKVRAKSYDYEEEYLQYQTTFMIHISVSAYPY